MTNIYTDLQNIWSSNLAQILILPLPVDVLIMGLCCPAEDTVGCLAVPRPGCWPGIGMWLWDFGCFLSHCGAAVCAWCTLVLQSCLVCATRELSVGFEWWSSAEDLVLLP